ncbi:MAG: hypothetical protein ACLFUR_00595 [Candidatus Hadarchaeia archaeon]
MECPDCGSEECVCIARMYPVFMYKCNCGRVFREVVEKKIES